MPTPMTTGGSGSLVLLMMQCSECSGNGPVAASLLRCSLTWVVLVISGRAASCNKTSATVGGINLRQEIEPQRKKRSPRDSHNDQVWHTPSRRGGLTSSTN